MTGKRKSGRRGGTASKKETPEKARRSSRRRGQKKSTSEEDSASEQSVDGLDSTVTAPQKQDSQESNKGDESGGSDGAWQVRSENGGKGGIPKLKISLHRPSDTSSPSSEPLSSPVPRRSRRGGNEEASEDGEEKQDTSASETENDRRSSRSRRKRGREAEVSEDEKIRLENEAAEAKKNEENEKRALEEAKRLAKEREEKEKRAAEEAIARENEEKMRKAAEEIEKKKKEDAIKEQEKRAAEQKEEQRKAEEEKMKRKAEEEKEKQRLADEEMKRKIKEEQAAEKLRKEREDRERKDKERLATEAAEKQRKEKEERERKEEKKRLAEAETKRKEEEAARKADEAEREKKNVETQEVVADQSSQAPVEIEITDDVEPASRQRSRGQRSPSRDSSEERAKIAALASRKPKKREASEDGEVVDSPEMDISFPVRTEGKIRTTASNSIDKENKDAPIVRKRRWGTSSTQASKKPPISISTDVLKEIIPEVKPVAITEVELSPNPNDTEVSKSVETRRTSSNSRQEVVSHRRRRSVPSDESEKDYEEEGVESGGEEMVRKDPPAFNRVTVEDIDASEEVKEVALPPKESLPPDPLESLTKQRSPSPARHPVTNVLYITNLVRPFTVVQLRDLLARTGTIVEDNGFWIDAIKSKCFVKYSTEDDAKNTRHALHGVRWPASNPKQLNVDYGTEERMTNALEGVRPGVDTDRRAAVEERREREKEREMRDMERRKEREERRRELGAKTPQGDVDRNREVRLMIERERERERDHDVFDKARDHHHDDKPPRIVRKVTIPVREWDLGKAERGFSPPPADRFIDDDRRKREKEREGSAGPYRKIRRKEEEPAPRPSLDSLFRKTKAAPFLYWQPLTTQQIAEKEAIRRKHIEDQEKRLAEDRKRREGKEKRKRTRSRSPKK